MSRWISTQTIILLLALAHHLPLASASRVTRACEAKWSLLKRHRNLLQSEVVLQFSYNVGLQKSPPRASRYSWEKDPESLQRIVVSVSSGTPNNFTQIKLSDYELSSTTSKTDRVTVRALRPVGVWQLVASSQGSQFVLGSTEVTTSELEPPIQPVSCSATYNVRDLITSSSRVRLRHDPTGKYMVLTGRKFWEAATLGYSSYYYFSITDIGSSVTRIRTLSNRYYGYHYAYSSTFGGIYFDEYDAYNTKQKWVLSNHNPRDGDSVTIMSGGWPGAYMTYHNGWTTDVFCEYRSNPDRWTIELVG